MAVSFKVPASPKKSIFNIDEFLGVDLTNTGSNIDEVRSPNAENMVRYVPGKVRKRTGYEKNILFGPDVNVNYAVGTSSDPQSFVITEEDVSHWVPFYYNMKPMKSKDGNAYKLYVEFDYMSSYSFRLAVGALSSYPSFPATDEWEHASVEVDKPSTGNVKFTELWSNYPQTIYIKNYSIMYAKNDSYEWSPSPKYYIERETTDPIYGCHILRNGSQIGNHVVNVNRALETSSEFEEYTLHSDTAYSTWTTLYMLGECFYIKDNVKRTYHLELDYTLTGDNVAFSVAGARSTATTVSATAEEKHLSATIKAGSYTNKTLQVSSAGNSVLQIKNVSVCYDTNESYEWSIAPEDAGSVFPTNEVYYLSRKNYADVESQSVAVQNVGADVTYGCEIIQFTNPGIADISGFSRVSFDLYTETGSTLEKIEVYVVNDANQWLEKREYTSDLINEHFDFYVSAAAADKYCNYIKVRFIHSGTGNMINYDIKNIVVNAISPKFSYDISPKNYIYHVGTDFYMRPSNSDVFTKIFSGANRHLSQSWQMDQTLFIIDGKDIYSYQIEDESVLPISDDAAYIPLVTISKNPDGGGVSQEPLNMLQPGFYEQFVVTTDYANETVFHLSFSNLDATQTKAWILNSAGNWVPKTEGSDYSVDRTSGIVTFVSAPGISPLKGEDNVKILAYRTISGYRDRVANCTIGTVYGVGGAADRLFISGNPDYPNWDFYSERNDPTYFPDTGYASLGSSASAIVGYSIVNNYLATFKDGGDLTQSVFIREGDLVVNETTGVSEPAFKLINTLQGHGVIAPYAFGNLQTEPVFLTKAGVYAITAQDITGEKYSQNRSFYLNGKLTQEPNLENAVATVYNEMYILAVNNQLYILDGLQATRTDRSEPYATRQYVGYHCTGVPALCIWNDDALWFGTADGRVCRFYTDIESLDSYNDDGKAIYCCWETPDLDGKLFYKNKTFRYFAIRMMKALRTSVKLYSQKLGVWSFIKEDVATALTFDFATLDFEHFSFSTDNSEKVIHTKVRVKKVDKARFKVENDKKDEPFGLFDLALEYVESGNYKR